MKAIVLCTLLLLLSFVTVYAQPVSFTINGADSGSINVQSGDEVKITVFIEANTYVYGFSVETEDALLEEIIASQMTGIERFERELEDYEESFGFVAPDVLPGGEHEVVVTIDYSDSEVKDGVASQTVVLNIPTNGSNKLVGFLTGLLNDDSAAEVVDVMMDRKIEPLPQEPTQEELLRLSKRHNFDASKASYTKIAEKQEKRELTDDEIEDYLNSATNEDLKEVMAELKGKKQPVITKDLKVYEVSSENITTYLSKIIISIEYPGESLNDIVIVEDIPKEVAAHVNDLTFSHKPIVIEEDPIVKWQFDHVPDEQAQQVSYTVDKELDEVPSETYAGGSESGFFAKLIAQLIESLIKKD